MVTIAVITAMDSEYEAVKKLYSFCQGEGSERARIYGKSIWLIKSGIGKVNAALAADKACRLGADIIINTGLAGGIDASLKQGDVVLADKTCYHDVWCGEPNAIGQVQDLPLYFPSPSHLLSHIKASVPEGEYKIGLAVTGDCFLTDVNKLNEIKKTFPEALAVDMESASIAQACWLNGKRPYISIRIISDVVGKPAQEEQYRNFWQNIPHKASEVIDNILKAIPAEKL